MPQVALSQLTHRNGPSPQTQDWGRGESYWLPWTGDQQASPLRSFMRSMHGASAIGDLRV